MVGKLDRPSSNMMNTWESTRIHLATSKVASNNPDHLVNKQKAFNWKAIVMSSPYTWSRHWLAVEVDDGSREMKGKS